MQDQSIHTRLVLTLLFFFTTRGRTVRSRLSRSGLSKYNIEAVYFSTRRRLKQLSSAPRQRPDQKLEPSVQIIGFVFGSTQRQANFRRTFPCSYSDPAAAAASAGMNDVDDSPAELSSDKALNPFFKYLHEEWHNVILDPSAGTGIIDQIHVQDSINYNIFYYFKQTNPFSS